jgi:hypothetical protein
MALSDYVQHIERNEVLMIDFSLTKGLRHIVEIPPFFLFFEKDDSSDLWEVAMCLSKLFVNDGMIPFPLCLLHTVIEDCMSLWLEGVGNGASKFLSSRSLLIQSKLGWSPFSLHLADLTR